MSTVYLNGVFMAAEEAKVSVFDRGFLFADSVYELIPVVDGQGLEMQAHLQRFANSLKAIGITVEMDWQQLCLQLVEHNGGGHQAVYVQVSRGSEGRRSMTYSAAIQPTVFACCQPIPAPLARPVEQVSGVKVVLTEDVRWGRCDIKSTMLLPNILARQLAQRAGAEDALLVREGLVLEGSSCNLFIVRHGEIVTPPLSPHILGGTTRSLLLQLARQAAMPVSEADISVAELCSAEEVWLSSSSRGVLPVVKVDEQPVANGQPGPVWAKMAALYQQHTGTYTQP